MSDMLVEFTRETVRLADKNEELRDALKTLVHLHAMLDAPGPLPKDYSHQVDVAYRQAIDVLDEEPVDEADQP